MGYLITGCTVVALPIFGVIEVTERIKIKKQQRGEWKIKNMIKNESFKVGRRYSNTAELLTALVRPSKQWGPNQYQVTKKKLNHLFIKIFRLAKMTGLSLEHDQITKELSRKKQCLLNISVPWSRNKYRLCVHRLRWGRSRQSQLFLQVNTNCVHRLEQKTPKVFQYSNFEKVVVRLKFSLQSNRQLRWSQMCDLQQFQLLIPFLKKESKVSSICSVVHFVFWFINTAAASSCNLRCVTCNFFRFSSPFQTEEAKKVQSPCLYS